MKVLKRLITMFVVVIVFAITPIESSAAVAGFGTTGGGSNPFNPRGYYVELTDGSKHWLSSKFQTPTYTKEYDELGHSIYYTGVESGLDYVDATLVKALYCTTDRNPSGQGAYKECLSAFSKSSSSSGLSKVPNMSKYINTPARSYTLSDANGDTYVWTIKIDLPLEPGTMYEFAFLRGLIANNGTSCVFASDNSGYLKIPFTAEEQAVYDAHKYDEYEYLTAVNIDGNGKYVLSTVPMRYKVQTYADLSDYKEAAATARKVLARATNADATAKAYLEQQLNKYDALANGAVKKYLQAEADATQSAWIAEINELTESLKNGIDLVDLTEFNKVLADAEDLYNKTKNKVGTQEGNYGETEVNALKAEINKAKATIDELSSIVEVEAEIDALKTAMLNVKKSLVLPDTIIFHDQSTGIYVTAPYEALPQGVKLYVGQVLPGDSEYNRVIKKFNTEPKNVIIYKILFMQGQTIVEPTETVTVQIPVLSDMFAKNTAVYSVSDKANTFVKSSLVNNSHVFDTDEMGEWVMIEFERVESEKDDNTKVDDTSGQQSSSNIDNNQFVSQTKPTTPPQDAGTDTPPEEPPELNPDQEEVVDSEEEAEPESNDANELDETETQNEEIKSNELEDDERLDVETPKLDLSILRQSGDDDKIIMAMLGFAFVGIFSALIMRKKK